VRMTATLSIGDFARATHMSVKMLRHYHQIGLLEPADVDPHTGYRRYTTVQIPTAQVIRRFRDLEMPLDQVREVLAAPDTDRRNTLIAAHLDALEERVTQTQAAVTSLRDLLTNPSPDETTGIRHRRVEPSPAAAISETVEMDDVALWFPGALGELAATLAAQNMNVTGSPGGIYGDELFADERGQATVFIPCAGEFRPAGRVDFTIIPAVELATIVHPGPHDGIDRAYGKLAAYVARHELAVDGPIREYYTVGGNDTQDSSAWRTEIGWPIFSTGAPG
jgi:DNA-binding transcriptional MerR regulator